MANHWVIKEGKSICGDSIERWVDIQDSSGVDVCCMPVGVRVANNNAHLIAAAPKLLNAARVALGYLRGDSIIDAVALAQLLENAIDQTKGVK